MREKDERGNKRREKKEKGGRYKLINEIVS